MYNSNVTTMELYVNKPPERSDRADVVKVSCTMFQGKKDDNKKPMFVSVEAWKFQAKCLEGVEKGQTIIVTGNLRMDYWGSDQEKSALVLNADSVALKAWPVRDQGSGGRDIPTQPEPPMIDDSDDSIPF